MDYETRMELQRQSKALGNLLKKVEGIEKKIEPKIQMLDGFEVCKQLLVSERTLAQWRKEKSIEFVKIGNVIRYPQEAIIDMVTRNKVKPLKTR